MVGGGTVVLGAGNARGHTPPVLLLKAFVGGFLMGTADLIPGVSGGTVALVIGIYERLIDAVRRVGAAIGEVIRGRLHVARGLIAGTEWGLLLPLLAGILSAVALLSGVLEDQLRRRPVLLASGFFGLVAGSVLLAWRMRRRGRPAHWVVMAGTTAVVFIALGGGGSGAVEEPSFLVFFGAGALAVCAMILPGISGSLILVIVGMYGPILAAVNDRDLLILVVFVAGAATGLGFFSQLLHWALSRFHDMVLSALVGLMAGSLRIVWPWPDGVSGAELEAPGDDWAVALLAALIGLGVVVVLSRLAGDSER